MKSLACIKDRDLFEPAPKSDIRLSNMGLHKKYCWLILITQFLTNRFVPLCNRLLQGAFRCMSLKAFERDLDLRYDEVLLDILTPMKLGKIVSFLTCRPAYAW